MWAVSLFISNPFGDFPLNDDWSFGLTVKQFVESGEYVPLGWAAMPLVTHILWGSIFCLNGFSFELLRFSTLLISLLGTFGLYFSLRHVNSSRCLALMASLTAAFNPIYYALSHTFMTDVSFSAVVTLSVLFFIRAIKNDSNFDLAIGSVLVVAATLNRQLGIAISLAFSVSYVLKNEISLRVFVRALIPTISCALALLFWGQWLSEAGKLPVLYGTKNSALIEALTDPKTLVRLAENTFTALLYLGWFLFPVIFYVLGSFISSENNGAISIKRSGAIVIFMIFFALLSGMLWHEGLYLMPLSGNVVNPEGIGPFTLRDTYILHFRPHLAVLPQGFWFLITVLSLLGGGFYINFF